MLHRQLFTSDVPSPPCVDHEDAGPSEGQHIAQGITRPKSKYTKAGFVGFWACLWAVASIHLLADVRRPSSTELKGRQPGRDGSSAVTCTLDDATGAHAFPPVYNITSKR